MAAPPNKPAPLKIISGHWSALFVSRNGSGASLNTRRHSLRH